MGLQLGMSTCLSRWEGQGFDKGSSPTQVAASSRAHRCRSLCGEGGCKSGPAPVIPQHLWQPRPPLQIFPFARLCPPIPPVCLAQQVAGPSPVLFSRPHTPTLSPHPYQQTHISSLGMQGGCTDHLYVSPSVLPTTDQLLCFPVSLQSSSPAQVGLLSFRSLPQVQVHNSSAFLFFFFFLYHTALLPGDPSCPFMCLNSWNSFASVQQMSYEGCSICRCIFFFLSFFFFLGPHLPHMEVPRLPGLIGAVDTGLHHSHSSAEFESHL